MAKQRATRRRTLPVLPSLGDPPLVRILNGTAQRSEWSDPDARKAGRTISGWRTSCPLRRMIAVRGSGITVPHILAADRLRELADAVTIGYSGKRELTPAQGWNFRALSGFGRPAIKSAQAWPPFRAAMARFCRSQRELLSWVVLRNKTVAAWVAERREAGQAVGDPKVEMGRLLSALDLLAEHFASEVESDLQRGVAI